MDRTGTSCRGRPTRPVESGRGAERSDQAPCSGESRQVRVLGPARHDVRGGRLQRPERSGRGGQGCGVGWVKIARILSVAAMRTRFGFVASGVGSNLRPKIT